MHIFFIVLLIIIFLYSPFLLAEILLYKRISLKKGNILLFRHKKVLLFDITSIKKNWNNRGVWAVVINKGKTFWVEDNEETDPVIKELIDIIQDGKYHPYP